MNEHTEKLVRELAEKLGTTVEHLWGVLTKQAPLTAIADIAYLLVVGGLAYALLKALRALREKREALPRTHEVREVTWMPYEGRAEREARDKAIEETRELNCHHAYVMDQKDSLSSRILCLQACVAGLMIYWLILAAVSFGTIMAGFFNPEAWALKQMLK